MIVIGTAQGKAVLTKIPGSDTGDENDPFPIEFKPKQARSCTVIGFNPVLYNQFFTGLEKVKNDACLQVWDITTEAPKVKGRRQIASVEEPLRSFSPGEQVISATWFPSSPHLLAAGTSTKFVRLYDVRSMCPLHC